VSVALQLRLVGVFIVPGQEEVLLLDSSQDGGKVLQGKVGGEIGGYRLGRIGRTRVVLKGPGGDEISLPLSVLRGEDSQGLERQRAKGANGTRGLVRGLDTKSA